MFRPLEKGPRRRVSVRVDGRSVEMEEDANLAAALLEAGFSPFRTTPVSGAPREPYCMMGVCFDCLAVVDDVPNRQTCLETVRAGMTVAMQEGAATVRDVEAAS
ncbi:2Fe-2S iron-sulfur cluster-binding protein [Afifella sp. IM 167]|uniref:2Fe-2S iron-sulfur cluster-binding protein n=1 Tax=Afifella sp. IM 167 TaxID=2033586 RepID=UPI001CC92F45|nr:2Fe-2S iron-sulfur cluster-binding protein [Afifella sp. IM 167]MBZ8135444.1 sarcosine oxidase subunit alpha [Afifella sp. IM 167]